MTPAFFYGLFMDECLLRELGLSPVDVRLGYVEGYGLRIGDRATMEESREERTYGTIIQLKQMELDHLYSGEGLQDYQKLPIKAFDLVNHCLVDASTYLLSMDCLRGANPTYAMKLAAVAKRLNIPEYYIAEIESWATV